MRIHISIVVILVLVGYSCAEIISEISSASSDNGGDLSSSEYDIPVAARSAILVNDASDDFQKDKSLIIAVVNDYMDRVFENVHNFAIKSGLDPTPLQNLSQKVSISYFHNSEENIKRLCLLTYSIVCSSGNMNTYRVSLNTSGTHIEI
ncbi:unnamed protein product [Callosobruchus maculatus]|uniref:Uncharacterized protein n=1 Tax=Callosobruchus maculatus TaxID=64391 RepID=A0A653CRJ6_CALMS|nr:unnamed protein product [Callosobruchus maculatus]